jgi:hypothetical protein
MTIKVKNWTKFQHYKHRDPPWIRLYRSLLNEHKWYMLDGDASKVLVMCWLIASENDGKLPPLTDLAFRLRINEQQCAEILSRLGDHWLELDASITQAARHQHALPETETESEKNRSGSSFND